MPPLAEAGHRTIAAELDRLPGTVRGWLRAFGRRAEALARCGWRWAISLGEEPPRRWPAESPLAYGLEALRWAYEGYVESFGRTADFSRSWRAFETSPWGWGERMGRLVPSRR